MRSTEDIATDMMKWSLNCAGAAATSAPFRIRRASPDGKRCAAQIVKEAGRSGGAAGFSSSIMGYNSLTTKSTAWEATSMIRPRLSATRKTFEEQVQLFKEAFDRLAEDPDRPKKESVKDSRH